MADNIGNDDEEKSLYLVQILYLEEQLERCQLKCDALENQNKDLTAQSRAMEKDNRHTVESLKCSVAAKETEEEELNKQLASQPLAVEEDRNALILQHTRRMKELQEKIDELKSVNMMQMEKIEQQKEQMMQDLKELHNLQALKKKLVIQKEKSEAAIHTLRMKFPLEQEKLMQYESLRKDYVTGKIAEILNKDRAENRKCIAKMEFLQSHREVLQEEINALQGSETQLHCERDNLKTEIIQMILKKRISKKEVERLSEKYQQLTEELKHLELKHQHKEAETEALRQRVAPLCEEYRQTAAEVNQKGPEIEKERSRSMQLESVMAEGALILRYLLTDTEKASHAQWKVQRLLDILDSSKQPHPSATPERSVGKFFK